MRRSPLLPTLVVGLLATLAFFCSTTTPACLSTGTGKRIEAMSEAEFASMSLKVELITRALLGRLVKEELIEPKTISRIADAVDAVRSDQDLVLVGTGLVSKRLKADGWTDDEVLLAVMLVEDYVRKRGGIGEQGLPLGPHARELLKTISVALRQAAGGGSTTSEDEAAERALAEAGVSRGEVTP